MPHLKGARLEVVCVSKLQLAQIHTNSREATELGPLGPGATRAMMESIKNKHERGGERNPAHMDTPRRDPAAGAQAARGDRAGSTELALCGVSSSRKEGMGGRFCQRGAVDKAWAWWQQLRVGTAG